MSTYVCDKNGVACRYRSKVTIWVFFILGDPCSFKRQQCHSTENHVGDRVRGIGNDGGATGEVTRQGFTSSQADIGGESQTENPLAFLAGEEVVFMIAVVVRVANVPPLRNLEVRVFKVGQGMVILVTGTAESEGSNDRIEVVSTTAAAAKQRQGFLVDDDGTSQFF